MIKKKVQCPSCKNIQTITGLSGETIKITCVSCGTTGKVTLAEHKSMLPDTGESNGKPIVQLRNLTKRYKDLLALDNVSLSINQGEVFGYIGPNGAGKTTTIKILIDLIKKTSGDCIIDGYTMPEEKTKIHRLIGYLPQRVSFQSWRTVDHALTSFGKLSGMSTQDINQRMEHLLRIFDLSSVRHKKITQLSGGMIQKIGLIQALLHNPKLLILDEPLAGLDPESRYQIKQIIKDIRKEGKTVFFSSHILSDVQDIATKIGILNWGHIEVLGSLDELKARFARENILEIILTTPLINSDFLTGIEGIQKIEHTTTNTLHVHLLKTKDNDEIIYQIMMKILNNKYRIRSITSLSPNLDELYQKYVGKRGGL